MVLVYEWQNSSPNNIFKHIDSLCQLVLHVLYILKYRYYLGIQLLQRLYIYIYMYLHIHSNWYLHWWFLLLDFQVAFWLTRQFQWNSFSKWKCKFQSIVPAQVVAIFFAYFMVTCCINAQTRQPFYRNNCLVRLHKCSFNRSCALLVTVINLYWHNLSFTHSH